MPTPREGAVLSPASVTIPVADVEPELGGGTVAGNVCWPMQNKPQEAVVVMGGKIAPPFCACIRSVIRPPQPLLAMPFGIAVCH